MSFPYEELKNLFCEISSEDKFIIICRYVLNLQVKQIAEIENYSRQTIHKRILQANRKLKKVQDHDELVAVIQEMFAPKVT